MISDDTEFAESVLGGCDTSSKVGKHVVGIGSITLGVIGLCC